MEQQIAQPAGWTGWVDPDGATLAEAGPADWVPETPARRAWLERRRALEAGRWRSTVVGPRPHAVLSKPINAVLGLGLKASGLWRRGVENGLDLRLRTLSLSFADLPEAFDGYRILQISDPHLDCAPGLPEVLLDVVRGVETDLCVFTGDFRAGHKGPFTETGILEAIGAITREVRAADGFLGILGNHDAADMVPHLERLGIRMLLNETTTLRRAGAALQVTGVDDVHAFYTPAAHAALATRDDAAFKVLLAHSPELAADAADAGHALYLCGHCHGGQVCLPGGRAIVRHLVRHRDLYAGLWRHGSMAGYTSTGAGLSGVPVRFNCRGEVTLFVLRRSSDEKTAQTPLPS